MNWYPSKEFYHVSKKLAFSELILRCNDPEGPICESSSSVCITSMLIHYNFRTKIWIVFNITEIYVRLASRPSPGTASVTSGTKIISRSLFNHRCFVYKRILFFARIINSKVVIVFLDKIADRCPGCEWNSAEKRLHTWATVATALRI